MIFIENIDRINISKSFLKFTFDIFISTMQTILTFCLNSNFLKLSLSVFVLTIIDIVCIWIFTCVNIGQSWYNVSHNMMNIWYAHNSNYSTSCNVRVGNVCIFPVILENIIIVNMMIENDISHAIIISICLTFNHIPHVSVS